MATPARFIRTFSAFADLICWVFVGPLASAATPPAAAAAAAGIVFPADSGVLDVRAFGAKGDGVTDDTAAIQQALNKYPNGLSIVYLPAGTYLVSDRLDWPNGRGGWEYKHVGLQGQDPARTVIRLRDRAAGYGDPAKPRAVVWTGPSGGQAFANFVRGLTIDTGRGNPGAVALQFNANNTGCVRDVVLRCGDDAGACGLDMTFNDQIGPLLVKNVSVVGFDYGIRTAHGINSQTFEHVVLRGQRECGWLNDGQVINVRNLQSVNDVTALRSNGGTVALIDADLRGGGGGGAAAAKLPAVSSVAGGKLFVRNLNTTGYANALVVEPPQKSGSPAPAMPPAGASIDEYAYPASFTLFDTAARSLGLAVEETPDVPWDPPADWISPTRFGAIASDGKDDTDAVQRAIDAGKPTVYFPNAAVQGYPEMRAKYVVAKPIVVRGKARRLIGCEAALGAEPYWKPTELVIGDGDAPVVVIERLHVGKVTNRSARTVVFKDCEIGGYFGEGAGKVFFEDVCCAPVHVNGQTVYARQLNPELVDDGRGKAKTGFGPHVRNDGGTLWILGLKTEGGDTLVETRGGGRTEILGAHLYNTGMGPAKNAVPAFVSIDSNFSVTAAECNFGGGADYRVYVRETRGGVDRDLAAAALPHNYGSGKAIPLFSGRTRPGRPPAGTPAATDEARP